MSLASERLQQTLGSGRGRSGMDALPRPEDTVIAFARLQPVLSHLPKLEAEVAGNVIENALSELVDGRDPGLDIECITVLRGYPAGDFTHYSSNCEELLESAGVDAFTGLLLLCTQVVASTKMGISIADINSMWRYDILTSTPDVIARQLAWLLIYEWDWLQQHQ